MARTPLGALTTLNLSTHLDPMFIELYAPSQGSIDYSGINTFTTGNGTGVKFIRANGGTAAAEGAAFTGLRNGTFNFTLGSAGAVLGGTETADFILYGHGAISQRFYTNGSERFRIDASGNVGIGGTGAVPSPGGRGPVLDLYSGTTQPAVTFHNSVTGTAAARGGMLSQTGANFDISNFETGTINFSTAGTLRGSFSATGTFTPGADNAQTLGSSALRWSVVYAGTGTINTSDAREKTAVQPLADAELEAAIELAREIGSFQWLASIDEKGEALARVHIGLTVQRAIEIMSSYGLDPLSYAFICYDKWDEQIIAARFETRSEGTGILDGNGSEIVREWQEEVEPERVNPAGDRYGFRYDQLAMFILRGQDERQRRIEARLAALESQP